MRLSRKQFMILTLAAIVTWMLWPRGLDGAFDTKESIAVSVTVFDVKDGQLDNTYETFELDRGSDKGQRIGELLSQHTYHLTLGTLVGEDTIEDLTMAVHLFNSKGEHVTLAGGTRELSINGMVYRLDYWGSGRGTALCEDVLEILREA